MDKLEDPTFMCDDGTLLEKGHIYILHLANGTKPWVSWNGDVQKMHDGAVVPLFVLFHNGLTPWAAAGPTGPIERIEKVL